MSPFDARPYLKEIARGSRGARDLTREQARERFAAIFDARVGDVALGAILAALRVKGENADELAGMMDALEPHVMPLRLPAGVPTVVLPTYNGARQRPTLVPLLAGLLAREGVAVLLHGAAQEAHRVGTFEVLERMGHAPAGSIAEAEARLQRDRLAAVPLALLSPALARLIDRRNETGVRNSGHTLAKLLLPAGVAPAAACRVVAVTHPDFMALLREHFRAGGANAFLMRGVEGEPVARLKAPQPIEYLGLDGEMATHAIEAPDDEVALPTRDAAATAAWTRDVLEGRAVAPPALARQAGIIAAHCRARAAKPSLKVVGR